MKHEHLCPHRVFRTCRRKLASRTERRLLNQGKCRRQKLRIPVWAYFH